MTKELELLGDSLDLVRSFPEAAKQDAEYQLHKIQEGDDPDDWRPMKAIGSGVREIRIAEDGNQYRVIYHTKLKDVVYVLHAFIKKTQRTAQRDIEVARMRLKELRRRSSPPRQS